MSERPEVEIWVKALFIFLYMLVLTWSIVQFGLTFICDVKVNPENDVKDWTNWKDGKLVVLPLLMKYIFN